MPLILILQKQFLKYTTKNDLVMNRLFDIEYENTTAKIPKLKTRPVRVEKTGKLR